jgi:hypothetical protein
MSRQIIRTDNDLKIISKIFEFLAEGHEIERSRTFLESKDSSGRAFRYVAMKDWPNESKGWGNGKIEVRRSEEAFRNMVERMSDEGTPKTSLYAYLEDNEANQEEQKEEGEEKEEDSNQED